MSTSSILDKESGRRSRVSRGGRTASGSNPGQRSKGWKKKQDVVNGSGQEGEDEDEEEFDETRQCLICAEKITYASVSPCNHITCHVCTFRQRALYEKKACLVCRTENETVIFTEQLGQQYSDLSSRDITSSSEKFQIDFTADYVKKDTLALLDYACPTCHVVFPGFKELGEHTKSEHNKYYCIVCSKNKKAFISELTIYTYKQLQKHLSEGDGKGFKGHPECKFCRGKRFYSEDELNIHIRDKHERCHMCDQDHPKTADYYRNYDHLYTHFKTEHYVCSIPICVEQRFVVFREELDLTAHLLKEHGGITGSNGKVVIGSSGRLFQSQLSTFNSNSSAGPSRRRNQNLSSDDIADSYETKKMRLEERVKHYLNYNNAAIKSFSELNSSYKSKNITARDLLTNYKEMFKNIKPSELSIILYEFRELFNENSQQYKDLLSVTTEYEGNVQQQESYPVLGGSTEHIPTLNSWGSNNTKKTGTSELFPALPKPQKSSSPTVKNNQPIRYTTILKKPGKKATSVNINNTQASSDYRPNYLSSLNKSPPVSSLPTLGLSNGSRSSSTSSIPSIRSASLTPSSRTGSSSQLDSSKFPALEKKSTKKVIPRVNPVNVDPGDWGGTKKEPEKPSEDVLDLGIPITDKRKQKMKKKQDQVLFKM